LALLFTQRCKLKLGVDAPFVLPSDLVAQYGFDFMTLNNRTMSTRALRAFIAILFVSLLAYAQTTKPTIRYLNVGKSVRGRSIVATVIGSGTKRVIVLGAIHGDEQTSATLAKALASTLARDPLSSGPTVIIVSEVNPDGLADATRVNASGVDINRNFPSSSWRSEFTDANHYPGMEPASEPETRAVIDLIKRYPPDLLITLHAALGCMNWDGPGADLAAMMASINEYPLCQSLGYETPGSLGTLAGVDMKIPTVTIELRASPAGELVRENLPALRAVLAQFRDADASPQPSNTEQGTKN
jgi:protein MpaA